MTASRPRPFRRRAALRLGGAAARARLEELNAVTRRYGRPFTPAWPLDVVIKELPAEWYRSWNA